MLTEAPDEQLVRVVLSGDDDAFRQLVTRHKQRLFRLASRFTQDKDEREDICQETFIRAYQNLANYRQDAPFEHWLVRIAVRSCHDALRKQRRVGNRQRPDIFLNNIPDEAEAGRSRARQARQLLDWAMSFLKADERVIITLLELEEMTVKEISDLTGWSESNTKVRAWRARQTLRKILEKHDAG